MSKESFIYAYQLRCGDYIRWSSSWFQVLDLRGGYVPNVGAVVDVKIADGWHRAKMLTRVKVLRHE